MLRSSVPALTLLAAAGFALPAHAELWNPLDTVPKPNVIIGFDHSVTMGIQTDCQGCHNPGSSNTRLAEAKIAIQATLPVFQNQFVFGGFTYKGCNSAGVTGRVFPDTTNPDLSFSAVQTMISNLNHCTSSENNLPGGVGSASGCILDCGAQDRNIFQDIMDGQLPGFSPTAPTVTTTVCSEPMSPFVDYDVLAALQTKAAGIAWPQWAVNDVIPGSEVQTALCNPVQSILEQIRSELDLCLVAPNDVWDLSFLANPGTWCEPGTIGNSVCTTSLLQPTCICDQTLPGCFNAPVVPSDCGIPLIYKARQQVSVCEAMSPKPGTIGASLETQPDNIIHGAGGCRENVAMFFTDGHAGGSIGVAQEYANLGYKYASPVTAQSNMYVFRISGVFAGEADAMQASLSDGATTQAYDAISEEAMRGSFARTLSRVFQGAYTGASVGVDAFGTVAALHSFTVPGYNAPPNPISDTYLGWPARIALHTIDPDTGVLSANPVWETDDLSKVIGTPQSCSPQVISDVALSTLENSIGPNGVFPLAPPVYRSVQAPPGTLDTDGDGIGDNKFPKLLGRMYSHAHSTPVIVDAPRELPTADKFNAYFAFLDAVRTRARMIYVETNGYVLGFHGGDFIDGPTTVGNQNLAFHYDTTSNGAGVEVLRYKPTWIGPGNAPPNYRYTFDLNSLVQQEMMTGQLVARELFIDGAFKTVLVGNQGKNGPGYFALDVSNPCSIAVLSEWTLPAGAFASADPEVYEFRTTAAPTIRPVVVTTSGLDSTLNQLYAYDVSTNPATLLSTIALPAVVASPPVSYPSSPACVDATGEGHVTHCYVLRSDGHVIRVEVRKDGGGFANPLDVTQGAAVQPFGNGRVFGTGMAVFFGTDGAVNLVFGSGNFRDLTGADAPNFVYKFTDRSVRKAGVPNDPLAVNDVCSPGGTPGPGVVPLPTGERVVSKPVVQKGVVAWTTYRAEATGCISGSAALYAMDFETCTDAVTGSGAPTGHAIGDGIPPSPTILRSSETILTQTSGGPTAGQTGQEAVSTRGGESPALQRVYWFRFWDNR